MAYTAPPSYDALHPAHDDPTECQGEARRTTPWRLQRLAIRCTLATAAVASLTAGAIHARDGGSAVHTATPGHVATGNVKADAWQLLGLAEQPPGACAIPQDFCGGVNVKGGYQRVDALTYRDCDGDGIKDPYCKGGELLRFGYVGSKSNCQNTWPTGVCLKESEPTAIKESKVAPAASNEITIVHFNDVYEVAGILDHGIRRGGMSRAAHIINRERARNPNRTFVVFAGDLLSPSVLSRLFHGEQMVNILNYLSIDAASLGNHEFDQGVGILAERMNQSNFPWLNINLLDAHNKLLPGTQERFIRDVPFKSVWEEDGLNSTRVCVFGAAYDVRETMFIDKEYVNYKDVLNATKAEVKRLREQDKCKVVLALTHQFASEDCTMSKELDKGIDLILGGHDHSTAMKTDCGHAPYVKADSDLKTQWIMTIWLADDGTVSSVDGRIVALTDEDPFDTGVHDKIIEWQEKAIAELYKPVGCTSLEMDTTDKNSRSGETGTGNWFTDSIRAVHHTDVALWNGGAIRGNTHFTPGPLTRAQLLSIHPFGNTVLKIYATGSDVRGYIEDCLKCLQDVCGAFVHVSGLNYTYDGSAAPGSRLKALVFPNGTKVEDSAQLTVAMSDYMLANSKLKENKLFNMVTKNDGVPVMDSLFEMGEKAGASCINPAKDGRLTKLR